MTRKELITVADKITNQIEEANLVEEFSTELAQTVQKYEWMIWFEGRPAPPINLPQNGGEAHARIMDALSYVLSGEIIENE